MSNWTTSERPSLEIWPRLAGANGDLTFLTWGNADRRATTSLTAARTRGSLVFSVPLRVWTSTCSAAGWGNWSARTASARPELPVPSWPSLIVFMPSELPMNSAARTKAIQPKMAVLRWVALQRPMRPARGVLEGVVAGIRGGSAMSEDPARGASRSVGARETAPLSLCRRETNRSNIRLSAYARPGCLPGLAHRRPAADGAHLGRRRRSPRPAARPARLLRGVGRPGRAHGAAVHRARSAGLRRLEPAVPPAHRLLRR